MNDNILEDGIMNDGFDYQSLLAKEAEREERFAGNPTAEERTRISAERLGNQVQDMVNRPDYYSDDECAAALSELNKHIGGYDEGLSVFTQRFGGDKVSQHELLKTYWNYVNEANKLLNEPLVGPFAEGGAKKRREENISKASDIFRNMFSSQNLADIEEAERNMSHSEYAQFAESWLKKNHPIDYTSKSLTSVVDTDKLNYFNGEDPTKEEHEKWVKSFSAEDMEKYGDFAIPGRAMWDRDKEESVKKSYRKAYSTGSGGSHQGRWLSQFEEGSWEKKYQNFLDARREYVKKERLIGEMKKQVYNDAQLANAMSVIPFLDSKKKELVAEIVSAEDRSKYAGMFSLMDEEERKLMQGLVYALRPTEEMGFGSGFMQGLNNQLSGAKRWLVDAYYQGFKDTTLANAKRKELDAEYEFNRTVGWDKLKEPTGFWARGWAGMGQSLPLQIPAIAGTLALGKAATVTSRLAKVGLFSTGAAAEGFGLLSMVGLQYDNLRLNGVDTKDAIFHALGGGAMDWIIEKADVGVWLGMGLEPQDLLRLGAYSSAKAAARCFSKKAIAQFGKEDLQKEFWKVLRANTKNAFTVMSAECLEEFAQGLNAYGVCSLAQGRSWAESFLSSEAFEAGAKAFEEALPTCTMFGLTGTAFPAGSMFGLNNRGKNINAAAQLQESLNETTRKIALQKYGENFTENQLLIERNALKNRASQVVEAVSKMSPELKEAYLNELDASLDEKAYIKNAVEFHEAARMEVGESAANAFTSGNLQLFRYEMGGAKFTRDKDGKVTSVTFKDGEEDVTYNINDLTSKALETTDILPEVLRDFIEAYNAEINKEIKEIEAQPPALKAAAEDHLNLLKSKLLKTDTRNLTPEEKAKLDEAVVNGINGFYSKSANSITLTSQANTGTLAHETSHGRIEDAISRAIASRTDLGRRAIKRIRHALKKGTSNYDEATARTVEAKAFSEVEGGHGKIGNQYVDSVEAFAELAQGVDTSALLTNVANALSRVITLGKVKRVRLPVIRGGNAKAINALGLIDEVVNEAVLDAASIESRKRGEKDLKADEAQMRKTIEDSRKATAAEVKANREAKKKALMEAKKAEYQAKAAAQWDKATRTAEEEEKFWNDLEAEVEAELKAEEDARIAEEAARKAQEEAEQARRDKEAQEAEEAQRTREEALIAKALENRKNALKSPPRLRHAKNQDGETAQRARAAYTAVWKAKMGKVVTNDEVKALGEEYGLPPEALNLKNTRGGWKLSDKQLLSDEALAKLSNELVRFWGDVSSVRIVVSDVVVATAEEAANAMPNEAYDPISNTFIEGRIVVDPENAKSLREQAGLEEVDISPAELEKKGKSDIRFSLSQDDWVSLAGTDRLAQGWTYTPIGLTEKEIEALSAVVPEKHHVGSEWRGNDVILQAMFPPNWENTLYPRFVKQFNGDEKALERIRKALFLVHGWNSISPNHFYSTHKVEVLDALNAPSIPELDKVKEKERFESLHKKEKDAWARKQALQKEIGYPAYRENAEWVKAKDEYESYHNERLSPSQEAKKRQEIIKERDRLWDENKQKFFEKYRDDRQAKGWKELDAVAKEYGVKSLDQLSGDTLFSLASAARYNEELYNKALEMEKRGESREKIFDETGGMWKDKDGHWLIELPELSLSQIKELKDKVLRKINESDKDYYGITYGDILNYVFPNAKSKLGKLIEVYPRLASLPIFFFKGEETRSGYTGVTALNPSDNYKNNGLKKGQAAWIEVALGRDKIHKIRSSIVHELQHFIQGEEGWSNGTTYKPTAHTSDDKTTREIEYALNRGEINAKVAGLRSKPTSTKIVFAGKNVYPWETEQYIRDKMAQKVWNLKKKSLWTNANLNPDLSVEENARAFKDWYKKVPATPVPDVLTDTSPQAVFDWFEKNMVGKTYVFDLPKYGRRVFRVSTGHIGKLVCTGSNKGVITKPLTKRWPDAVRNGEVGAKDVNGWDYERAKQLPRIPVLLTEFDAVLHEKDRGIDVFIFLKKFESKNGRPNTIVMKLVDDDVSIGPISTHMRDLTLSWLKNKDLSLTKEGEVYNRSMNNSAIQRPPNEDNAERNSSSGINSLPHSAEGVNGGISFSLRSPVERRKDLVAFHNVSARGLKGMDDLGGMAVPSFAVTKDTIGGNEFGEITLLVRPETIDPERRGNKIYTGDAWTPSFPETRIKVNEDVVDKIQERIYALIRDPKNELASKVARGWSADIYGDNISDYINRSNGDAIQAFSTKDAYKVAYLLEKGMFQQLVKHNSDNQVDVIKSISAVNEAIEANKSDYESWLKELTQGITDGKKYIRNNKDFYTPRGERRSFDALYDPLTLANAVKAMLSQQYEQGGGFGGRNPFGVAARKYNSLEDVIADEKRLQNLSYEEKKAIKEELSNRLGDIVNEYNNTQTQPDRNQFIQYGRAKDHLLDSFALTRGSKAKLLKELNQFGYTASEDLVKRFIKVMKDMSRMPEDYFEAKAYRGVGFDEIAAAIIPDNATDEVKAILSKREIEAYSYKAEDKADRLRALNEAADAKDTKFSLSSSYSEQSDFNKLKSLAKPATPDTDTKFSWDLGVSEDANTIAALAGAAHIIAGNKLDKRGMKNLARSLNATKDVEELLRLATNAAKEQKAVLDYIASDPELDRIISRAGKAKRHARVVERTRKADVAWTMGVNKKVEAEKRALARQVRDIDGITADEILSHFGLDPQAMLLAMTPPEREDKGGDTGDNDSVEITPTPITPEILAAAESAARAVIDKARQYAAEAKKESAKKPIEEKSNNTTKTNESNASDDTSDAEDIAYTTTFTKAFTKAIKESGITLDNPAEMVKLAEVMTEAYVLENPTLYAGLNTNNIWSDPRVLALLAGNIGSFAKMAAEDFAPSYTRERVTRYVQMLRDHRVNSLQAIEDLGVKIFKNLNKDLVRQSRQELIKEINNIIDKRAEKYQANKLNKDRKIESHIAQWLGYVKKAISMSSDKVEQESQRLQNELIGLYGSVDSPEADKFRDGFEKQLELAVLSDFGNLKGRMPAEIMAARDRIAQEIDESVFRTMLGSEEFENFTNEKIEAIIGGIVGNPKDKGFKPEKTPWMYSLLGMFEARSRYITRFQKDETKREAALNALGELETLMQSGYDAQINFINEAKSKVVAILENAYGSQSKAHDIFSEEIEGADWYYRGDDKRVKLTYGRALQMYVSIVQSDYAHNVEKWGRDGDFRTKLENLLDIHNPDSPHLKMIEGMRQLYIEMGEVLDEALYRSTGTHLRTPNKNYMPVKMNNPLEAKMGEGRAFKPFAASLTPRVKNGLDFDQEADIMSIFESRLIDTAHTIAFAERGPMIMRIAQSSRVLTALDSTIGTEGRKEWSKHILDIVSGVNLKTPKEAKVMQYIMRFASPLWLGLNPASWAKQMASIPCYALSREVGLFGLVRAQSMWLLKPIEMLGVAKDLTSTEAWKARYGSSINQELRYVIGDASKAENLWQKWLNFSMSGISGFDKVGILVNAGLYARRREELEMSGIPSAEASELAAQFVMHLADKTMQSGREVNMTEAQRSGSFGAFLQFKSSPMQMLQFEALAMSEYAANPNAKNLKKLVEVILINHALAPAIIALIDIGMAFLTSWGIPDEEKRKSLLTRILGEFLTGPWSGMFILGAIADWAADIPLQYVTGEKAYRGTTRLIPAEGALDFIRNESRKVGKAMTEIGTKDILETMSEMGMSLAKMTPGISWTARTADKIKKSLEEQD